ncbi:MAG TPA: hypothetical protein VK110_08955 [Salinisphaeraceae bacterium]|nr:hypothetical protein [Salinisphaeraceae bacterium]
MAQVVDRIERKLLIFSATIVWLIGMLLIGSFITDITIYIGTWRRAGHACCQQDWIHLCPGRPPAAR